MIEKELEEVMLLVSVSIFVANFVCCLGCNVLFQTNQVHTLFCSRNEISNVLKRNLNAKLKSPNFCWKDLAVLRQVLN